MNDTERKALFEEGVAKDAHYRTSKARESEIARLQVKARVQADLDDRNIFMAALVDDHGFTVADIGRIMSTTNRATAKAAVEAGRALRGSHAAEPAEPQAGAAEPADEQAARYLYHHSPEGPKLTVTLWPSDFQPYREVLVGGVPTEPMSAGFSFDGRSLLPQGDDWEHPVVTVMMLPEKQREAIAFINEQN